VLEGGLCDGFHLVPVDLAWCARDISARLHPHNSMALAPARERPAAARAGPVLLLARWGRGLRESCRAARGPGVPSILSIPARFIARAMILMLVWIASSTPASSDPSSSPTSSLSVEATRRICRDSRGDKLLPGAAASGSSPSIALRCLAGAT